MNQKHGYKMLALSLVASALLAGCGSGGDTIESTSASTLGGSVIKGPVNDANLTLRDMNGTALVSVLTSNGKFTLPQITLQSPYYILESMGGTYLDEATETNVTIPQNQSLKTLLSKDEIEQMISTNTPAAITPETTIYAGLVEAILTQNPTKSISEAMTEAETIIDKTLIEETSPLSAVPGDKFLKQGDLTSPFPKDQTEAFARNRAISFSYMTRDMGLSPEEVFTLIERITENLKDGQWDNEDLNNDGVDDNATEAFGLARTKLFQDTTTKLQNGELSEGQREELRLMGFDVDRFNNSMADAQAALQAEVSQYLSSDTLPPLRRLPELTDEDGNLTDAAATYTLTAQKDVNVTIETPEGSWITPMWRYNNQALPVIIRTNRGNAMTLNFQNNLDANSTIHWHGFKIPADMDGGPDTPVEAGNNKSYTFTMDQPAAPLWFHPHPDMQTGKQVYMGLAGVFLLEDAISTQLENSNALPSGDKDIVLLVQDRRFDGNTTDQVRNLKYMDMEMDMDGMLGDTVLVNGSVVPKLAVSNTMYRFRLYNVSNARTYKFALSDGSPFKVIATDGGLLDTPTEVTSITLGAAERVEIVIDFANYAPGDKVMLVSEPFNGDMMSMMGGMNNSSSSMSGGNASGMNNNGSGMNGSSSTSMGNMDGMQANGAGLSIMRFDINSTETETVTLYSSLPSGAAIKNRLSTIDVTNPTERQFVMSMGGMGGMSNGGNMNQGGTMNQMTFVINGKAFAPDRVDEFIQANATEIWSIKNMSPMAHPFHAHAIQYQILSRNGIPASGTDLGWKDTFLVQPGETVKVIGKFEAVNQGDYMYHCHILEHEDAGMMGYFRVGDTGQLGPQ